MIVIPLFVLRAFPDAVSDTRRRFDRLNRDLEVTAGPGAQRRARFFGAFRYMAM